MRGFISCTERKRESEVGEVKGGTQRKECERATGKEKTMKGGERGGGGGGEGSFTAGLECDWILKQLYRE